MVVFDEYAHGFGELVEIHESLIPLVRDLSPRERRILALRFFADMTRSQIAEQVGISQLHVSRLLNRTLSALRDGMSNRS